MVAIRGNAALDFVLSINLIGGQFFHIASLMATTVHLEVHSQVFGSNTAPRDVKQCYRSAMCMCISVLIFKTSPVLTIMQFSH